MEDQPHDKPRTRRRFAEEFKRDAVELARTSGKPVGRIANELGAL